MKHTTKVLALLILAVSAACGGSRGASAPDSQRSYGNGTVVQGQQLQAGGGNLLNALIGRVTNLRVQRGDNCPRITFRGGRGILGGGSPNVYIDRSRFRDTCILDQIQSRQVARVEIYPNGHTTRPGYEPSPHGLILVFLTSTADGSRP